MAYAKGKKAFGFCDRTGFRYKLTDLVDEVQNGVKTGFKVGRDVVDPDHPQNHVGRLRIADNMGLMNPRPERKQEDVTITFPIYDLENLRFFDNPFAVVKLGNMSVIGAVPTNPIIVSINGFAMGSALGTPTYTIGAAGSAKFSSTAFQFDGTSKTFDEG